ncbi:Mitoferrin-1 [Monoraphidium neglectum]|uniref:Mitoferrin-1 n=1 Tax=Monoraphidium neglectum TaxID=145388 RepID=A0A0D2M5U4_9CHLO|nr:Mitoferrin-1 [Monoraphidium neglectum]KIY96601.1 Mitoferrin-1 [Monoraphidium neglectum]|eukprot:XP_013895621.1 Mitoferrin-1 [Monoraphidium neglectum]
MSRSEHQSLDLTTRGYTVASVVEGPAAAAAVAAAARTNPGHLRAAVATMADGARRGDAVHVPASDASTSAAASYDGLTFVSHMLAGSVAGVVEHTAMYPVDTIKTRMQALSHPGQRLHTSTIQALRAVLRREGARGLYRGVGAVAGGAGPAHALYFATYEAAKSALGGNAGGHQPLAAAAAGATATLVNDAAMTPFDVIKQRLQVAHSPYKGTLDCVKQVLRQEGVGALFRSYRTTIVMNIPYTAVHFSVYESAKTFLLGHPGGAAAGGADATGGSSSDCGGSSGGVVGGGLGAIEVGEPEEGLAVQLVAGGLAGGAAAAVTTPLDVVKTRLQTEGVASPRRYRTSAVLPVLRRIISEEGAAGAWRGLRPRVLFHAPAAAICWGTYESMKGLLGS